MIKNAWSFIFMIVHTFMAWYQWMGEFVKLKHTENLFLDY